MLRWGLLREEPKHNEHRYGCRVPAVGGSMKVKCRGCKKVVVYGRSAAGEESLEKTEQPKGWHFWWWY
jgi:hypothetical protein